MRCEAGAEEAAAKAAAEKSAAEAKAKTEAEKGSGEARVKGALEKAELAEKRAAEAEAKLKAIDDAKLAEEDEKKKKKGEYETLLKERDDKLTALTGEHGTAKQQLEAYEKVLKGQLETALKGVSDEAKRKTVEKLLDGKSLADKVALLPEVLTAIGASAPATFGGPTPTSGTTPSQTEIEQKKKKYSELLAKPNLTPQERNEKLRLMTDLEEVWNQEQAKKKTT